MYRELQWFHCCFKVLNTNIVFQQPKAIDSSSQNSIFLKPNDFKVISPLTIPSCLSLFSLHLELIDGTPTLKINHGSGTVVLQLPGNVNVADRRWHRLDVRSNSKVGRFTYLTPTTIYLAI